MYTFVFAHVVVEKHLSVLEGFLPWARAGGEDPCGGVVWVQDPPGTSPGPPADSKPPYGLNTSQLSALLSLDPWCASGTSQGKR